MIGEAVSVVQALKSATDAVKTLMEVREIGGMHEKALEAKAQLLAAYDVALSAREREEALLAENRKLKERTAQLEQWDAGKDQYELHDVGPGAFAYVRKADAQPPEKPHWLCVTCFDNRRRSVLQYAGRTESRRESIYKCGTCGAQIRVPWSRNPAKLAAEMGAASQPEPRRLTSFDCPYCGAGTELIEERPDPTCGELGLKQHKLRCADCHKEIERQFDPSSGYVDEATANWESEFVRARRV